jgi:hypothetical protein
MPGGMQSDIYPTPLHQGRALMLAGLMNSFGPLIGRIIAGYAVTENLAVDVLGRVDSSWCKLANACFPSRLEII